MWGQFDRFTEATNQARATRPLVERAGAIAE